MRPCWHKSSFSEDIQHSLYLNEKKVESKTVSLGQSAEENSIDYCAPMHVYKLDS